MQRVVSEYAKPFADSQQTDLHGNLILARNPGKELRVMLAGHADQIGMLVAYIDDGGMIYVKTVGGWDPQQLIGQRVIIWTHSGPVSGVISRKAIHLQSEEERKQLSKIEDLWVDIGAKDKAEATKIVAIGDSVTLQLGFLELMNGLATAPAMDNRTGLWVVVEALRRATALQPHCSLYAVSTVQEEIGLRGAKTAAFSVDPQIGVAVDVTHATDTPNIDKRISGEIKMGSGPVIFRGPNINPKISQRFVEICEQTKLPYQMAALGIAAPNDSNSLQVNRAGVATGLLSIPNRYMHSAVEVVSLVDLENTAELLARFCVTISDADEFLP